MIRRIPRSVAILTVQVACYLLTHEFFETITELLPNNDIWANDCPLFIAHFAMKHHRLKER